MLLDTSIARTLDAVIERFSKPEWRGKRLEAWLFEDEAARRDAERRLSAAGVNSKIRSAYKPLLHFLLEETDLAGVQTITIRTPNHEAGSAERFRSEVFPLAGLFPAAEIRFEIGASKLDYDLTLHYRDGRISEHTVFAPNRVYQDHLDKTVLTPAGWLRAPGIDEWIETEFEECFRRVMAAVRAHPWPTTAPYFETLDIRVQTGGIERPLPWHDECISTREGLHEDFYFSILEWLKHRAGLPRGDRTLQPGQIIPDIRPGDGPTIVRVELLPATIAKEPAADSVPLENADKPLLPARIHSELAAITEKSFSATSRQGRKVAGGYVPGSLPGIVISGGQHANETSGVVGALRAAKILKQRPGIHFALIPQENPDGYALHFRLREGNPRHMHHAARYTAFGDDLQNRTAPPFHETEARREAVRLTGAGLHLNLHGYPAHEWTRPLTGYRPRGFGDWAIPKGFYLILRHRAGLAEPALAFLKSLTQRLAKSPDLVAYNESQLAAYRTHVGELPLPVYNSIPCQLNESDDRLVPLTLITEYPDETIYDDAFRLAHTTQMHTVLHAVDLYLAEGGLAQAVGRQQ